jgi:RNA polymerase sigma-70 factor (ECF subfamily)
MMAFSSQDADNVTAAADGTETGLCDEALLAAYRQTGDSKLFAELVGRYERELYNYLRRYLNDAELADDVFQMAFLMVHIKCDQFEPGRRFRPWLYAVATNAAIDAQRREKRHKAVSLDRVSRTDSSDEPRLTNLLTSKDPDPMAEASRMESGEWVQQALDGLSTQMRDVVNLVYFQGLKYREAAETLNVPVGTIKSRLHSAVQKLYDYWNDTHSP